MRVLWLAHRDPHHPSAGGAERTIREIGSRLAGLGWTVDLLGGTWPGALKSEVIQGIRVHRVGARFGLHWAAPLLVKRLNPDVVVDDLAHVVPWGSPWFGARRVLVFFHHLHARTLGGQTGPMGARLLTAIERMYPRIYRSASFVTESDQSASDLGSLGISSGRISQIRPGVTGDTFRVQEKYEKPTLCYFGGFRRYKRPETCAEVLVELRKLGIRANLLVIGDGPELENLRAHCRSLGVQDSVRFLGRVSDQELGECVSKCWVNLHFATAEGWGFTISEAAVAGVPTVAFATPGVEETVLDGRTGLLVPNRDLRAFAESVATICKDYRGWCRRTAEAAPKRSWEQAAEDWRRLLLVIVEGE